MLNLLYLNTAAIFLQNFVFWDRKVERQLQTAAVPPAQPGSGGLSAVCRFPGAVGSVPVATSSPLALPEEHRISWDFSRARGSLQPWSQGVIAVVVFLVLVAIAFVVNRFWCKDKVENAENVVSVEDKPDAVISNGHEGRYVSAAADFRSKENQHAYENPVEPEEKVITTAM